MMDRLGPTNLLVFLAMTPHAAASQGLPSKEALAVPVAGSGDGTTFTGTLHLQRFATEHGGVVAVGALSGTLSNVAGAVTSIGRTVSLRVVVGEASCRILHLDLEVLSLRLPVDLSPVALDITAEAGTGDLLCGIAPLLDDPSGLARLLNQILGLVQS